MANVSVYNMEGNEVGKMDLNDAVFGVEVNEHLVHMAVVAQLANNRQGTQKAKTRSEVSGGGRKPWRQKGTGHARQGSTRAPQWTGGGIVFAPTPRDYTIRLNKKEKRAALKSALTSRVLENKFIVVDELKLDEIKRPDRDAQLVAENIAQQLENRVSFRRAMKSTMGRSMKAGVKGIKTAVGGRLGGADIARTEFYSEGTIPLQTLRADIDYGFAEADTTYGKLGVKVWIYKGEVLPTRGNKEGSDK